MVFLVLAIVQLFAVNSLDLYSSGVTLQALGLRVKRYQAVLVDTVICCGITFYAIFDSSFSKLLTDFVDVVICWIAPCCAIFLVDWVLRRYRYVPADLQTTDRSSVYWRNGGVHWPGIVAQTLGTVAVSDGARHASFYVVPDRQGDRRRRLQHLHRARRRWTRLSDPRRAVGAPRGSTAHALPILEPRRAVTGGARPGVCHQAV